jgi:hypothetical protein
MPTALSTYLEAERQQRGRSIKRFAVELNLPYSTLRTLIKEPERFVKDETREKLANDLALTRAEVDMLCGPFERAPMPDEVLAHTLEVYLDGVAHHRSQPEIAEELGIGLNTLIARLRMLEVPARTPTKETRSRRLKEVVEGDPQHYQDLAKHGREVKARMLKDPVEGPRLRAALAAGAKKTHDKWSELTEQVAAGHVKRLATLDSTRPGWRQDWVDNPNRAVGILESYVAHYPRGRMRIAVDDALALIRTASSADAKQRAVQAVAEDVAAVLHQLSGKSTKGRQHKDETILAAVITRAWWRSWKSRKQLRPPRYLIRSAKTGRKAKTGKDGRTQEIPERYRSWTGLVQLAAIVAWLHDERRLKFAEIGDLLKWPSNGGRCPMASAFAGVGEVMSRTARWESLWSDVWSQAPTHVRELM